MAAVADATGFLTSYITPAKGWSPGLFGPGPVWWDQRREIEVGLGRIVRSIPRILLVKVSSVWHHHCRWPPLLVNLPMMNS